MSAVPTRIEPPAAGGVSHRAIPGPGTSDPAFPLHAGNRVLESLANRHALPSLLAFSALHQQIQGSPGGAEGRSDLLQTERFILDEVLQLLCDRAQSITQADGVIVALSEGSALVCRAGSGSIAVQRGVHLVPDSEILQDTVQSGRIFSVDDCAVDTRAELDLSRMLGARSTVIVPLREASGVVAVLQAFAQKPFAFSQEDIRSFDFLAELLLSALKPKDQHRRLNWLADVAESILVPKKPVVPAVEPASAAEAKEVERPGVEELGPTPSPNVLRTGFINGLELKKSDPQGLKPASFASPGGTAEAVPSPKPIFEDGSVEIVTESSAAQAAPSANSIREIASARIESSQGVETLEFLPRTATPRWNERLAFLTSSRPGLSGVLALVSVAALFSAGVWWGMQSRVTVNEKSAELQPSQPAGIRPAVTSLSPSTPADHLLDPAKLDNQAAPPQPNHDQLAVLPKITGVRHWSSSVGSTVVIDMEDQVPYEVHRLTAPERIYFDLHDTRLAPDLDGKSIDVSDSSLTRVRVAQPVAGVTRIVLDTRNGSNFSVSMESNPYRLIVELRDSAKTQVFAATKPLGSGARPQTAQPALLLPNAKQENAQVKGAVGRFHIVLDAGHGGWDLGTVGRDGLLEKDLVLDVTERLGKLLKGRLGADVTFTRTNDDYLPLDQRAEIANQAQADLFVSVHANYSKLESARGVETYYTNFFSAPGSREIEKRENGTSARATPVALSSGELREKIDESRHLAASVQRSLYATLASHNPGIRDRGVKDSAFVVLTGTTMPAILTEISFVSSPADERNLQNQSYRQQIAEALYKGISQYQAGTRHHVKMAKIQGGASASR